MKLHIKKKGPEGRKSAELTDAAVRDAAAQGGWRRAERPGRMFNR